MYDYDSSTILDEPIKNRQAATIPDALLNIHRVIKSRGSEPKVYIMDNDCSSDLKESMKKYEIDFQLAPPHMHRKNAVEREIRTKKPTSYLDSLRQIHISQSENSNGYPGTG